MTFPVPDFSPAILSAWRDHARREWPREACGLVLGDVYVACENRAANPYKDFLIADDDYLMAPSSLRAVLHSHPSGDGAPTESDTRGQIASAVIWGILPVTEQDIGEAVFWGDFRLETPLIGRPFIHGADDCGTLIRAWFWQERGVLIPDFARGDGWWREGKDLYVDVFRDAGFRRIEESDAWPGDIFLGMVRSKVPNHGGVLLDHGVGLHHLQDRLSRRESVLPWRKFITHWLRHDSMEDA